MKARAINYDKALYSESVPQRPTRDGSDFIMIAKEDRLWLERPL